MSAAVYGLPLSKIDLDPKPQPLITAALAISGVGYFQGATLLLIPEVSVGV